MRPETAQRILRAVPSLAALGLFAFALLGATDPNATRPVPDALVYPNCNAMVQSAGGDSLVFVYGGSAVRQPIGLFANVAACSVSTVFYSSSTGGACSLVEWDPAGLAPDPTTVALRSVQLSASAIQYGNTRVDWSPPVVIKSLATVADPPRAQSAIQFGPTGSIYPTLAIHYTPSAPPGVPAGYVVGAANYALGGGHGAVAHAVCGGDQTLQDLVVAQGVTRCDATFGTVYGTLAQRFRVSVPVQLWWVELAFGDLADHSPAYGSLAILDAQDQLEPPTSANVPLVSGVFQRGIARMSWGSHFDFDRSVTLLPNHDYWLYVAINGNFTLYARQLTGGEGPAFTSGVGECWTRPAGETTFYRDLHRTLAFKIVGHPYGVLSTPESPPALATGLRLRVTPNPSRGVADIAWTGASGTLAFEVLDARGRRVARGEAAASPQGTWRFDGSREGGRPLPAGVYFVRVHDAHGASASERLVIVR